MLRSSWRKDKEKKGQKDGQDEGRIPEVDPFVALDRKLHGIDEEKCQDCKDDMDTLLVFAGLYSAVLTSFLVQSYQNLLESPQETSNDLLRQIASQTSSYTLVNGQLNSTASPIPPAPFQVAIADIRINVCWFASLILSLSTASFGILVKQWLREYLAIGSTVPEERIRIRHYRKRSLEDWKLFEIAAALPLVLQLSLSLFFVGLCFFTAEIHPSLRATSLALVSGWALLFAFTFLAPLVSARCPYKTTFLKTVFRRVRPHLRAFLASYVKPFLGKASTWMKRLCQKFTTRLRGIYAKLLRRSTQSRTCSSRASMTLSEYAAQHIFWVDPDTSSDELRHVPSIIVRALKRFQLEEDVTIVEEDDARTSEKNDLIIFKEVDNILRDDGVLAIMRGAFQRKPQDAYRMLRFVVSMLHNRLGVQALGQTNIPTRKLSLWTCLAFTNILYDVLQGRDGQRCSKEIMWLLFLLAQQGSMLDSMSAIFTRILADRNSVNFVCEAIGVGETEDDWQRHAFTVLSDAFRTLHPSVLRYVVHRTYVAPDEDPTFESNTYGRFMNQVKHTYNDDPDTRAYQRPAGKVLPVVLDVVVSILQDTVDGAIDPEPRPLDEQNVPHVKELLQFFLDARAIIVSEEDWGLKWIPRRHRDSKLMEDLLATPAILPLVLECLGAQRVFMRGTSIYQAFAYPTTSLHTRDGITCILSKFVDYLQVKRNSQPHVKLYNILLIYLVYLDLPQSSKAEDRTLNKQTSSLVTEHLKKAPSVPTTLKPLSSTRLAPLDEQAAVASLASSVLSSIDGHAEDSMSSPADRVTHYLPFSPFDDVEQETAHYSRWKTCFDIHRSMYSDELIMLLRLLADRVTDYRGRIFWRVRRLDDLEKERSEALGDRQMDAGVGTSTAIEAGEGPNTGSKTPSAVSLGDGPLPLPLEGTGSQDVWNADEEASNTQDSRAVESNPIARGEPVLPEEMPTPTMATEQAGSAESRESSSSAATREPPA